MAVRTFAAIDIGSYNVSIEIFEFSGKNGFRSLNRVRTELELGADTFSEGRISIKRLNELTKILSDYKLVMKDYGTTDYRACAKSAFREAENRDLVVDHIYQATGIKIDVISNAVQRILSYKSVASKGAEFEKVIEKGTAIVDMGGGSVQISLFDKDALVSTQNLLLGSLRIRAKLSSFDRDTIHYDELVGQLIHKDISNFKRMYLKNQKIENVILVGDYFTNLIFHNASDINKVESKDEFRKWYDHISASSPHDVALELGVSTEMASVIIPTAVVYKKIIEELGASTIWLPGVQMTDGIAYDYGEKKKLIKSSHDFEKDIVMAAKNIARRYAGNKQHNEKLLEYAVKIFDAVKRVSPLDDRSRLLLKAACYLHDCGKYISLTNVGECSYNIISSTEIIGLSTTERKIIANVVRYNTEKLGSWSPHGELTVEQYLLVARLVAIMRLANGLDQSYTQKIKDLKVKRKDRELILTADTDQDLTLERGIFNENVDFFEEIFDLKPVLKKKKSRR